MTNRCTNNSHRRAQHFHGFLRFDDSRQILSQQRLVEQGSDMTLKSEQTNYTHSQTVHFELNRQQSDRNQAGSLHLQLVKVHKPQDGLKHVGWIGKRHFQCDCVLQLPCKVSGLEGQDKPVSKPPKSSQDKPRMQNETNALVQLVLLLAENDGTIRKFFISKNSSESGRRVPNDGFRLETSPLDSGLISLHQHTNTAAILEGEWE
jgi:hypothetical protein